MDTVSGPVGLYSISVRGLDMPDLLGWAAGQHLPFLHVRGGPRGFDLAAQPAGVVREWAALSAATVPVTGVTADIDLADLLNPATGVTAGQELARLVDAATALGAGWVRLLARTPLTGNAAARACSTPALANTALPLLVELHHPGWLTEQACAALWELLGSCPKVWLLADTAQLASALPAGGPGAVDRLGMVFGYARVLHLSDSGAGLDTPGQVTVAELAAFRAAAGQDLEVALEWTGPDRSPSACLARHHATTAWWADLMANGRPSSR